MAFAGGDNMRVIDNHHKRITQVHTKDVRKGVMQTIDKTKQSFLDAVVKGVFTVPGDGDIDFSALIKRLAGYDYEGWFVVEAEQDPKQNLLNASWKWPVLAIAHCKRFSHLLAIK